MVIFQMEENLEDRVSREGGERKPRRFDVTGTHAYRELYANNLRMYSFLMKKELDRKKHQNLRNRKEEYFQNHLSLENSQRNNRLLKSFRQMSRMRTCLSDLDLSKVYDSESENANKSASASRVQGLDLNLRGKGERPTLTERPRSWSAFDQGSPKSPLANYHQGRRASAVATTNSKYLSVPSYERQPSPLTSLDPDSSHSATPVLVISPTRQTYVPALRRHVSDLGGRPLKDYDMNTTNSDSDIANSDSEAQSEDAGEDSEDHRKGSPSLQRARQAKKRYDYRKARIASLETEILKADSVIRNLKKSANHLHGSIPESC